MDVSSVLILLGQNHVHLPRPPRPGQPQGRSRWGLPRPPPLSLCPAPLLTSWGDHLRSRMQDLVQHHPFLTLGLAFAWLWWQTLWPCFARVPRGRSLLPQQRVHAVLGESGVWIGSAWLGEVDVPPPPPLLHHRLPQLADAACSIKLMSTDESMEQHLCLLA